MTTKNVKSAAPTADTSTTSDATAGVAVLSDNPTNRKGNYSMNDDLFDVLTRPIGEELVPTTDARSLHAFLENGEHFATWISQRIEQYGFIENVDYVTHAGHAEKPKGGRPSKEYAVTLGMAKELAMVERNQKGQQARRYFLDCEKYAREMVLNASPAPVAPALDDIKRAEAIIQQRDIAAAYHLQEAARLTGKLYRAVKPPKPREPKALPAPDDKTRVALSSLMDMSVEFQGAPTPLRELVSIAASPAGESEMLVQGVAVSHLRGLGIVIEDKQVLFGTGVPFLQEAAVKLFGDKQGLRPFLITVPGSQRPDRTQSFNGAKSKVVKIPLAALIPRVAEAS